MWHALAAQAVRFVMRMLLDGRRVWTVGRVRAVAIEAQKSGVYAATAIPFLKARNPKATLR